MKNEGKIKRVDRYSAILFPTLKALQDAMLVYANDHFAEFQKIDGCDKAQAASKSFKEEMDRNMSEERLSSSEGFEKGYYDTDKGIMHTLYAYRRPNGVYTLGITVRNVGSYESELMIPYEERQEALLAKKVGAPVGYAGCEITRKWPTKEYRRGEDMKRFSIPLSDIEDIFTANGVTMDCPEQAYMVPNFPGWHSVPEKILTGIKAAAANIMKREGEPLDFFKALTTPLLYDNEYPSLCGSVARPTSTVPVFENEQYRVTLWLSSVGRHEYDIHPERDFSYRIEGEGEKRVLTGPAELDCCHETKKMEMTVNIFPKGGSTTDKGTEQAIRQAGNRLMALWGEQRSNPSPQAERMPVPV